MFREDGFDLCFVAAPHMWRPTWQHTNALTENPAAARKPASVPCKLTAPSVQRGTALKDVMRYVGVPYAFTAAAAAAEVVMVTKAATAPVPVAVVRQQGVCCNPHRQKCETSWPCIIEAAAAQLSSALHPMHALSLDV
jgi:hypothetical protein